MASTTVTTSPLFNLIERERRAERAQHAAWAARELRGQYAWRWADGDEWEPVDGLYPTDSEAQVRHALARRLRVEPDEIVVEQLDV